MANEVDLRFEDDKWSLDNIKKFAVASFHKRKKKKKKEIFIAVKKSLI